MISKEYTIWEQNINLFSGDNRKTLKKLSLFSDVQNPELEKFGQNPPILYVKN
jgi:peptide chain release factor 3